jgi:hypothetical protein
MPLPATRPPLGGSAIGVKVGIMLLSARGSRLRDIPPDILELIQDRPGLHFRLSQIERAHRRREDIGGFGISRSGGKLRGYARILAFGLGGCSQLFLHVLWHAVGFSGVSFRKNEGVSQNPADQRPISAPSTKALRRALTAITSGGTTEYLARISRKVLSARGEAAPPIS